MQLKTKQTFREAHGALAILGALRDRARRELGERNNKFSIANRNELVAKRTKSVGLRSRMPSCAVVHENKRQMTRTAPYMHAQNLAGLQEAARAGCARERGLPCPAQGQLSRIKSD